MSAADLNFYALDPATQAYILRNKPALDPPAGQQPNFDSPPNGSAGVAVLFATCLILVTAGLAARVYTRFFCTKEKALVDCASFSPTKRGVVTRCYATADQSFGKIFLSWLTYVFVSR